MSNPLRQFHNRVTGRIPAPGRKCLSLLLSLFSALVCWLQVERAGGMHTSVLKEVPLPYLLLGYLTVLTLPVLLYAFSGRGHLATAVSGGIFTVFSLVNYYTVQLHGTAIMPLDVLNLTTAADVIGAYTIRPDETSVKLALLYLPSLGAAALQWLLWDRQDRRAPFLLRLPVAAAGLAVFFYAGYFGPHSVMPPASSEIAMPSAYRRYSYLPCMTSAFVLLKDPVIQPDQYREDSLAQLAYQRTVPEVPAQEYPDIILILNESYFDLSSVTNLQTDAPYNSRYQALREDPQTITGYTIVPLVGGGTNVSEYALLTSNGISLMPGATPFNNLKLRNSNSIATYLGSLGYQTLAAHPATAGNYRRGNAWPDIGFQTTMFEQDFLSREVYGDRIFYQTDRVAFEELTRWYEEMPDTQPKFLYLLTIQNHGGWDSNAPSLDTVHVTQDYGMNGELNEYLSCLALTDTSLRELLDYFQSLYEATGRRVIVAMTGDHAPSFVDSVADSALTGMERTLAERGTPFFIWSNYPQPRAVEMSACGYLDMTAFLPLVAEQAGLPLSPYFQYLLAMRGSCAVWDNLAGTVTPDGVFVPEGQDPQADALKQGYLCLEYNNISTKATRQQMIFAPVP